MKAVLILTLHSPIYWLTVLALTGASVWLFRYWVLSRKEGLIPETETLKTRFRD